MLSQPDGSRWYALFPVVVKSGQGREKDASALRDHLFELRRKGFTRLFQNGQTFEFSTPESLLDIDFSKPLFVLADRLVIRADLHQRVVDTVEICYRESGEVFFEEAGAANPRTLHFSEKFACKVCGQEAATPEPPLFSSRRGLSAAAGPAIVPHFATFFVALIQGFSRRISLG